MTILQFLLSLFTLPFLLAITLITRENVFQNNFWGTFALLFLIYFLLSTVGFLIFKRLKLKNVCVQQEIFSTFQFIFTTCVFVLPAVVLVYYFMLDGFSELGSYGRIAFLYFVLTLSISPLLVFIKNTKISCFLLLMRKIIGILTFIFFLKHALQYFSMEYFAALSHVPVIGYRDLLLQDLFSNRGVLIGIIAGILLLPVGISSNIFSIKFLSWNVWKKVQSLVYPVFVLACIHIVFVSKFDVFYLLLTLWLVTIRIVSYGIKNRMKKRSFLPVSSVSTPSSEPYYQPPTPIASGHVTTVIGYLMLTEDVLELILKVDAPLIALPGQYILLTLQDLDGEFPRAYSVVEKSGDIIKLWIKLKDTGRGSKIFEKMKIGDSLTMRGVYGVFVLKNTPNPKVFVATGTGIAPVYNMLISNTFSTNNILLRGVRTEKDFYYLDTLRTIKNLTIELFLSQENVSGYHHGRVDTSSYPFSLDTEFYLCGNSPMVMEQSKFLKSKGYKNIYLEIF